MRSAMRAASQLPGRGLLLWIWPLYLHVNKNWMTMMMMNAHNFGNKTFRPQTISPLVVSPLVVSPLKLSLVVSPLDPGRFAPIIKKYIFSYVILFLSF